MSRVRVPDGVPSSRVPTGTPGETKFPLTPGIEYCSIWFIPNIVGVFNGEGPPVPIPNTEVKLTSAENTCLVTSREDRSMPTQNPVSLMRCGVFAIHNKNRASENGRPVLLVSAGYAAHVDFRIAGEVGESYLYAAAEGVDLHGGIVIAFHAA